MPLSCTIANTFPGPLIVDAGGPCLSLYQPTHRYAPDNRQDPILFKNLVKKLEDSLKQGYAGQVVRDLLAPFYQLLEDDEFWDHTLDGLAMLVNSKQCILYRLYRPMPALAITADSPHIKPLLRYFQSTMEYRVLALERDHFVLYRGNRYGLDAEVIESLLEEKGGPEGKKDRAEKYFGGYGSHSGRSTVFFGHGSRKEDMANDLEKYFRGVDAFVQENFTAHDRLPVILSASGEHQAMFRKITKNPLIFAEGIRPPGDDRDEDALTEAAWRVMETVYMNDMKELLEKYRQAESDSMASADPSDVAKAVAEGRVETLLLEADRIVPGKIDPHTGSLMFGDLDKPDMDDVLDDMAEIVFRYGGRTVVLPVDLMPGSSGVAALYRY